jgi:ribosomal-protein-alanine N-acetyltransferase
MTKFPELKTQRLLLRLAKTDDIGSILSFYQKNEDHLASTSPLLASDFYTDLYWQKRIKDDLTEFEQDRSVRLFLFADNAVIGFINFSGILRGAAHFCYLGYGIALDKQGQGLMKEALVKAIEYMFNKHNIHRIMANYLLDNARSGKLLEKLGFTKEGIAKDYLYLQGMWQDHVLTSLTNHAWTSKGIIYE